MIPPGKYRHYKGNLYEVVGMAKHSETTEDMVIYQPLYGEGNTWVRPASMWDELVVVGGKTVRRFERVEDDRIIIAVKTTGIYCLPSCKSRAPLPKNVVYFATIEQAQQAGFRACKRCKPDEAHPQ